MATHVKKICPHCSFHNEIDATACSECGLSLKGDNIRYTTLVGGLSGMTVKTGATVNLEEAFVPENLDSVPPGVLALYFDGFPEPLLIRQPGGTIGRVTGVGIEPDIDLTPYKAYALGVSRVHAYIERTPDGYYAVQDLGSANHTFVNGLKTPGQERYPLRPGDRLKLANLSAFVYYTRETAITFVLQVREGYFDKITPAVLSKYVIPLLERITAIQRIITPLSGKQQGEVRFKSLTVLPGEIMRLRVQLENVDTVISMIDKISQQWAQAILTPQLSLLIMNWIREAEFSNPADTNLNELVEHIRDIIVSPFSIVPSPHETQP